MNRSCRTAFTSNQLLLLLGVFSIAILTVAIGSFHMVHSLKQTQVIRELKTMESAVTSYYIFSQPHVYPPKSSTVGSQYLTKVKTPKIDRPLYDPLSSQRSEYGYLKSANGKFYVLYSKGFNGVVGEKLDIDDRGKVSGLDIDDMCVTNGEGCDEYICCNGICGPSDKMKGCLNCQGGCAKDQSCVQGVCCSSDYNISCYGECINSLSDSNNCGGCDNSCPSQAICSNGRCTCPHETCQGTCVDTQNDRKNCGNCGIVCPSNSTCFKGDCLCEDAGYKACGEKCINTTSDNYNCGECGNVCAVNMACIKGACQCRFDICDDICTNTQIDANNCGTCRNVCPSDQHCSKGICQ